MQLDDSTLFGITILVKHLQIIVEMIGYYIYLFFSLEIMAPSPGLNHRFSAGWHSEDFVGRLVDALCKPQTRGLEESGLVQWYVGLLGMYVTPIYVKIC